MLTDVQILEAVRVYKSKILDGYKRQRDLDSNEVDAAMSGDVWSTGSLGQLDFIQLRQFAEDRTEEDFTSIEAHYNSLRQYLRAQSKAVMRYGEIDHSLRNELHVFAAQTGLTQDMEMPPAGYFNPNDDESYRKPTTDFKRLAQAYIMMLSDILRIELQRLNGDDTDYDQQRQEQLAKPNKTLSELCGEILTEQQQTTKKTSWKKVDQHHRAILRIMDDKNLREYETREITNAAAIIRNWPKKATLAKGLDGVPAADIVKRTDLGEPISYNMIKARLTQLCSTFKRALELDLIDRNPCPPLSKLLPVGKPQRIDDKGELIDGDRHLPWSNPEILSLLGTSYCTKAVHRVRTPENFWLPALAIFTGGRLNELAQLYCDDLLQSEDGLWLMRITRDAKRKQDTKNDNSVRRVPIHRQLIELGLLRYRDWIESKGHERLFPNLPYFPTVENFSNGFSKRIGHHFKRHVSWEDPNQPKTFHGLRSTFIQTLRDRNGVHEEHIRYLVGHAAQHKMTAHYGGAKPVSVLDKHLQSLDYGIDFVRLLGRWEPPKK